MGSKDFQSNSKDSECSHNVRIDSLCAICGAEVPKQPDLVPSLHSTDRVLQTSKEAQKIQKMKNKRLNKEKKLILILDLDQTVIHTTLRQFDCDFTFKMGTVVFYVKIRPFLKVFLKKISKLFEIHVYTMGTREYAVEICKNLDPEGEFFGNRIVSRSENFNEIRKSIDRITCISKNVIILDDRADIWNFSNNLVLIRPFWFKDKIDINDPTKIPVYSPGNEDLLLSSNQSNVEPETLISVDPIEAKIIGNHDKELLRVLKILKKAHKAYFKGNKNVSKILKLKFMKNIKIASKILHFSIIKFSGASFNIENPSIVLDDNDLAIKYKVKNIDLKWLYECIYRRKMVPIDSFVLADYSSLDEYQALLEAEFFE